MLAAIYASPDFPLILLALSLPLIPFAFQLIYYTIRKRVFLKKNKQLSEDAISIDKFMTSSSVEKTCWHFIRLFEKNKLITNTTTVQHNTTTTFDIDTSLKHLTSSLMRARAIDNERIWQMLFACTAFLTLVMFLVHVLYFYELISYPLLTQILLAPDYPLVMMAYFWFFGAAAIRLTTFLHSKFISNQELIAP